MGTQKLGRSRAAKRAKDIHFHSDNMLGTDGHPAIKVKYYGSAPSEYAWDATVEDFWFSAKMIAHEHGYSGVFSEGRSGGWLVPFSQYQNGKLKTRGQRTGT